MWFYLALNIDLLTLRGHNLGIYESYGLVLRKIFSGFTFDQLSVLVTGVDVLSFDLNLT